MAKRIKYISGQTTKPKPEVIVPVLEIPGEDYWQGLDYSKAPRWYTGQNPPKVDRDRANWVRCAAEQAEHELKESMVAEKERQERLVNNG